MDKYIDNHETQTYGLQFVGNIRRMFVGTGVLVDFMQWCADQLQQATGTMANAMATERSAGSTRSATAEDKLPVVEEGRGELKAFVLHLTAMRADKQESWNGDIELFVPGGFSSVGKGARAVHIALGVARKALHDDASVPERAKWMKRLDAQVKALAPLVERGDVAGHAHKASLSEQSSEKASWLRVYRGIALVLEGVLMMTGREGEYTAAVPHLTAPGTRKKTDGVPNVPVAPTRPSQAPPPA